MHIPPSLSFPRQRATVPRTTREHWPSHGSTPPWGTAPSPHMPWGTAPSPHMHVDLHEKAQVSGEERGSSILHALTMRKLHWFTGSIWNSLDPLDLEFLNTLTTLHWNAPNADTQTLTISLPGKF